MPVSNDPNMSDRVLAAEIYTRRIRNTVFGAILLVAWLVLLFKNLEAGIIVGAVAGLLYGIFALARWIVRVCKGESRVAAHRSAPAAHRPWRIEPTPGRPTVARPVETLEEVSELLDMVKSMPERTRAESAQKTHALGVAFGLAPTPREERRNLLLLAATAALMAWPFAFSSLLGTSSWPVVDWWYVVPGALLFAGGTKIICDAIAGDFRGRAREFLWAFAFAPAGLWLLLAHPVFGNEDPLTKYAVRPVVAWLSGEFSTKPHRQAASTKVDAIIDGILEDQRRQAPPPGSVPQWGR